MDPVTYIKPDFPADAFAGTAPYYVRYRPPYGAGMIRDLLARSSAPGRGVLLDLACGPGRVALALAGSFAEVWAVDLEPEMIDAAKEAARARGVANVRWSIGKAEDFGASAGSVDLITIGEAFHRLDQEIVATRALEWLRPRGCIAVMGCRGIIHGEERWQAAVTRIVRKWTHRRSLAVTREGKPIPNGSPDHVERVLSSVGFDGVASHTFSEAREWDAESILGYLYSTSVCSKHVLGADQVPFEAEVRAELQSIDPGGAYRETLQWGYTFGRKRG
jgi:SAM-dependent methyltransferase